MQLSAFRTQWVSELKLSSGASGISDRLMRAKGLKKTQEIAKEEKVSCTMISPGHAIPFIECCYFIMDDLHDSPSLQATELFLRAVQEEQNGAFYEGMYVGFTVTNEMKSMKG